MSPPPPADLWDRVSAVAPAPGLGLVVVTALLALAACAQSDVWRHVGRLVTIAHEGSHGLVAVLSGRRLAGIRLHSDSSGLTVSQGRDRGPGMVATAVAGYVGPGLIGLLAAGLLTQGHAVGVLWALLVLLTMLLLQIRNFYGLRLVLVVGLALVALTRWAPDALQLVVAYVVTWFLLLGAPRHVLELHRSRRRSRGRDRSSDAATLSRRTHLPALVWVGSFAAATLGCLLVGGRMLLLDAG